MRILSYTMQELVRIEFEYLPRYRFRDGHFRGSRLCQSARCGRGDAVGNWQPRSHYSLPRATPHSPLHVSLMLLVEPYPQGSFFSSISAYIWSSEDMGLIETGVVDVQVPDWLLVGVAYQGSCANGPARPDPPRNEPLIPTSRSRPVSHYQPLRHLRAQSRNRPLNHDAIVALSSTSPTWRMTFHSRTINCSFSPD